jgi:hypothetical protein
VLIFRDISLRKIAEQELKGSYERLNRALEGIIRDLGLYVLKEGINRRFFQLYFADPDGAVYEPGTMDDIDVLTSKQKRRPTVGGDLAAVVNAAEDPDPARRLSRLEKLLKKHRNMRNSAPRPIPSR